MSTTEVGVYITLLSHFWLAGQFGLPADTWCLSKGTGIPYRTLKRWIDKYGVSLTEQGTVEDTYGAGSQESLVKFEIPGAGQE